MWWLSSTIKRTWEAQNNTWEYINTSRWWLSSIIKEVPENQNNTTDVKSNLDIIKNHLINTKSETLLKTDNKKIENYLILNNNLLIINFIFNIIFLFIIIFLILKKWKN